MKNLIVILSLVVLASCSTKSPIQIKVEDKIQSELNNPKSYEFVSLSCINTILVDTVYNVKTKDYVYSYRDNNQLHKLIVVTYNDSIYLETKEQIQKSIELAESFKYKQIELNSDSKSPFYKEILQGKLWLSCL